MTKAQEAQHTYKTPGEKPTHLTLQPDSFMIAASTRKIGTWRNPSRKLKSTIKDSGKEGPEIAKFSMANALLGGASNNDSPVSVPFYNQ